jgi:hypothetical protein
MAFPASPAAGQFFADATGSLWVYSTAGSWLPCANTNNVGTIAALRSVPLAAGVSNMLVNTLGYYAPGDGGQNVFRASVGQPAGTYIDNGGTIIVPTGGNGSAAWLAMPGKVNIKQFGARGNGYAPFGQGASFTAVGGSANITATSINGAIAVGMHVCAVNWHSLSGPTGLTVSAVVGSVITLSAPLAAGTWKLVAWVPINAATCSGADDTLAIQAAVDYCLQNTISDLYGPEGNYLISNTIQMGYGNTFICLRLISEAQRAPLGPGGAWGCNIISIATDRPAINFQGGRQVGAHGIGLYGPNWNYLIQGQGYNYQDSSDPLDWLAPDLVASGATPGGLQQHAPLAGFTIDAWSGTAPAHPYPRTYPAWTGLTSAYGADFTSDWTFEDCSVHGFGLNIGCGLNTTNQGDYGRIRGGIVTSAPYGIGIFNTQSRNVEVRNLSIAFLHTFIDNKTLGMQLGEWAGPIDNICGGQSYQIANLGIGVSGPMRFTNFYTEANVRIGNFLVYSGQGGAVTFEDCYLSMSSLTGQNPQCLITASPKVDVQLIRTTISGHPGRMTCLIGNDGGNNYPSVTVDACSFYGMQSYTSSPAGTINAYAQAIGYCGGLLIGGPRFNASNADRTIWRTQTQSFDPSVGTRPIGDTLCFGWGDAGVRVTNHQAMKNFYDFTGRNWKIVQPNLGLQITAASGFCTADGVLTGDQLTFTMKSSIYNLGGMYSPQAGWMLFNYDTGVFFVITSAGTPDGSGNYPIVAVQQNSLVADINTGALISTNITTAMLLGTFAVIPTGIMVPKQVEIGTFTSGTTSVTNVSRGDNYAGDLTSWLSANDQMIGPTLTSLAWPVNFLGNKIATVTNGSPGSVTLASAALASGQFPIWPFLIY